MGSSVALLQGSQPVVPGCGTRRLRVSRGSAADPLNLLQVMLAKGTSFLASFLNQQTRAMTETIASRPQSSAALPNSDRVYVPGKLHADLRVPLREIRLNPTHGLN